jgi:UPF0755 protein
LTQSENSPKSSAAKAKVQFFQRVTAIDSVKVRKLLRKYRLPLAAFTILIILPLARFTYFLAVPPGNGGKVEIVELGRGSSLRALAEDLESRGILKSARLFSLYARMMGGDGRVKAGFYEFSDAMRPSQILDKMVRGEIYQRLFSLPEGYSTFQVAELLEKKKIFRKEDFLNACRDPKLLAEMKINAPSAEGYLFPGTYNILPGESERETMREMVRRQQEVIKEVLQEREQVSKSGLSVQQKQHDLNEQQVLTLASMVEKEAVLPEEMPLIAAVFVNRLKKGMRLQSDPTALYGVRAFAGKVTRSDILRPSPYNTYVINGLPPGPIGNPSKEAIDAVLSPPPVPYLYFVARGDGSHEFSNDLRSHNMAVRKYLK